METDDLCVYRNERTILFLVFLLGCTCQIAQKISTSVSKITLTAPGIMTQSGPICWSPSVPKLQQPSPVLPVLAAVLAAVAPDSNNEKCFRDA